MQTELRKWVTPSTIGVISFGIGTAVGYIFGINRKAKIDSRMNVLTSQIESVNATVEEQCTQLMFMFEERDRKFSYDVQQTAKIAKQLNDDGKKFLENVIEPVIQSARDKHPSNDSKKATILKQLPKEDEVLATNVFQNEDDEDWDYEEEMKNRSPDRPYVIHRDEFFSNEMEFGQSSLMYYVGDNILCDDHDVPVYNADKIVGPLMFGHGSQDPSIVYIRNEHLQAEYEVLIDHGYFQTEVLGEEVDLKHSRRVMKFREE